MALRARSVLAMREPGPSEFVETHISLLFLVGDRVYKLKKSIALPFLDWRDRQAREDACRREVALNRRLAPDVYLGVADVIGPDGAPCDHLVVMRRMPERRRLSWLVTQGYELTASIDELAEVLVAFHAAAPRSSAVSENASRDAVARNWDDNLAVLRAHAPGVVDADAVERVAMSAYRFLAGRQPMFEERARRGCVVDGHGDLLADDIYLLHDGPRILDCIDFSDALRAVDVLDDVAFLAMDLERLGAPERAGQLLTTYTRLSGDDHPASLVEHFLAYRAGVRAKVACIRADQDSPGAPADARSLLDLAQRHLETARVRLVLVGGPPGSGKSTLCRTLGVRAGWTVLRSDVVRKELAGLSPTARRHDAFGGGLYAPEHTAATYERLLSDARALLTHGHSVVLDASWSDAAWRQRAATVAEETVADLVELRLHVAPDVAARRLGDRQSDASDATPAVARQLREHADPWPAALVIDTSDVPERAVARAWLATHAT